MAVCTGVFGGTAEKGEGDSTVAREDAWDVARPSPHDVERSGAVVEPSLPAAERESGRKPVILSGNPDRQPFLFSQSAIFPELVGLTREGSGPASALSFGGARGAGGMSGFALDRRSRSVCHRGGACSDIVAEEGTPWAQGVAHRLGGGSVSMSSLSRTCLGRERASGGMKICREAAVF